MNSKSLVLRIAGGLAIAAASVFCTLFALDYMGSGSPDSIRAASAKVVIEAVQKFRATKGGCPVLLVPDSPLPVLAGPLVGGGYTSAIPADPPGDQKPRYVSLTERRTAFGCLSKRSGACRVEVGIANPGWWGKIPPCQL